MKPITIGFWGVGNLVCKQHLPNAAHSELYKIKMLCDLNEERLQKVAGQYQISEITTEAAVLLKDPDIDIIVVATAPEQHASMACKVLKAGKHAYVEKPLGETVQDCLTVAQVAKENNRHVAVGFNRRFAPAYTDAFQLVKADKGPLMMTYRLVDDGRDRPAHYAGWPRLLEECCHIFDIFNWFSRSRPTRMFTTAIGRKDDHQIIVEYENGVTGSLFTSSSGAFQWPKERLEIVGDHKVLAVDDFVELQAGGIPGWKDRRYKAREYDGFSKGYAQFYETLGLPFHRSLRTVMGDALLQSGLIESCPTQDKWTAFAEANPDHLRIPINYACDKGWSHALTHFGEAIRQGKEPENANPEDAALVTAMGLAAMESAKTGTPVKIPLL